MKASMPARAMGRTARRGVARTVALASAACGSRVRNPALRGFVGPVAGGVARIAHGVGMRVARRGENRAGYIMATGTVGGGRLLDLGAHEGRVGDVRVSRRVEPTAPGQAGGASAEPSDGGAPAEPSFRPASGAPSLAPPDGEPRSSEAMPSEMLASSPDDEAAPLPAVCRLLFSCAATSP